MRVSPVATGLGCLALAAAILWNSPDRPERPGIGDPSLAESRFAAWSTGHPDDRWSIALGPPAGHIRARTGAMAAFDFDAGSVQVIAPGIDGASIWLVDNQPGRGRSAKPERGDRMVRLGTLHDGRFQGSVAGVAEIDMVVVTEGGRRPDESQLLVGSPSLFQRLESRRQPLSRTAGLMPAMAFGATQASVNLAQLVEEGERLFTEETFGGNGRTCATCHRPENNFTIDPEFIATLPDSDPLFVAEFVPALNSELNGGLVFEQPRMMRDFGLIVANVDGLDNLADKFTLRGVPHTLGLPLSLTPDPEDGTTVPPQERTGWSGDGAPGSGTLRDFATGAVIQHFPLTMGRQAGVDFRLPTDAELDALAAFQLSLGRQAELDLGQLSLADRDAAAGLEAFLGPGKCDSCHLNAGANFFQAPFANRNFDTGVEALPRGRRGGLRTPPDGGFGTDPRPDGGFGDGSFNTPSLVEAADTGPFFHNNVERSLEGAVRFYNTRAFNNSPAGQETGGISLNGREVRQIARFLRVINALENLRETEAIASRVAGSPGPASPVALQRAAAELDDAIDQLPDFNARGPGVVSDALDAARVRLHAALAAELAADISSRNAELEAAIADIGSARAGILGEGTLADRGPRPDGPRRGDGGRGGEDGRGPGDGLGGGNGPGDGVRGGDGGAGGGRGDRRGPGNRVTDDPLLLTSASPAALGLNAEGDAVFALNGNYPNPFNPVTTIRYELAQPSDVRLTVFDVAGRRVRMLVTTSQTAGEHSAVWDGRNSAGTAVPSGTYLYRLSAGGAVATGTMLLLK